MYFTKIRGRPKKESTSKDLGTIELQKKRKEKKTIEPLDVIYHKNIISEQQYIAGCRIRYLYSLKYGVPHASAYDHTYIKGKNTNEIDIKYLSKREIELDRAITALKENKSYDIVSSICIFLEFPIFIYKINENINYSIKGLEKFKDGLSILDSIFCNFNRKFSAGIND